jgi:hypothetical protein
MFQTVNRAASVHSPIHVHFVCGDNASFSTAAQRRCCDSNLDAVVLSSSGLDVTQSSSLSSGPTRFVDVLAAVQSGAVPPIDLLLCSDVNVLHRAVDYLRATVPMRHATARPKYAATVVLQHPPTDDEERVAKLVGLHFALVREIVGRPTGVADAQDLSDLGRDPWHRDLEDVAARLGKLRACEVVSFVV